MLTSKQTSQSGQERATLAAESALAQSPILSDTSNSRSRSAGWRSNWLVQNEEWPTWLLGLFLAVIVFLAYSNTLRGPFQYDDFFDIQDNPSIRHLWPLRDVFFMPGKGYAMSRPVTNLSFALNYATGQFNPFPYHLTNMGIHIGATLTLFGVLRRTLSLPGLRDRFRGHIQTLALVTAALWGLHPLLTESVSYIVQRYESLMGLFVLLTFYGLLRIGTSTSPRGWTLFAILTCFLALGSKEVAVSLPVLVMLFDWAFLAGSFRRAWQDRKTLYLGLLLSWTCFIWVQIHTGARGFAGSGVPIPWWRYALNQPPVILHYLRLSLWPHPLNFDYYWPISTKWGALLPGLLMVGGLISLTVWALFRWPRLAYLSVFFFMILAPTSSVMPILDLIVEHRMYLPLIPVIVFLVFVLYSVSQKILISVPSASTHIRLAGIVFLGISLSSLGILTYLRNEDYQDSIDLWRDAVAKAPSNPRAHHNYAFALSAKGLDAMALIHYSIATTQAPNSPLFESNFGLFLAKLGDYENALKHLKRAVQLDPTNYRYVVNLGLTLIDKGSLDNAVICLTEAIRCNPEVPVPYVALASALQAKREWRQAKDNLERAILLDQENPDYRYRLGRVLISMGDYPAARAAFQVAIQLDGDSEKLHSEVGWNFHEQGMEQEAISHLRQALRRNPDHIKSQVRLAWILATSPEGLVRQGTEALALAEELTKAPGSRTPEHLDLLAVCLAEVGRFHEAQEAIREALAKSRERKDDWVPALEKRLELFEKRQTYREPPRVLPAHPLRNQGQTAL